MPLARKIVTRTRRGSIQGGREGIKADDFEAINVIAADLPPPPITTMFCFGVFWRRGTKEASIVTLIFAFLVGALSFVLDLPVFGTEKLISHGPEISFMMQAW